MLSDTIETLRAERDEARERSRHIEARLKVAEGDRMSMQDALGALVVSLGACDLTQFGPRLLELMGDADMALSMPISDWFDGYDAGVIENAADELCMYAGGRCNRRCPCRQLRALAAKTATGRSG